MGVIGSICCSEENPKPTKMNSTPTSTPRKPVIPHNFKKDKNEYVPKSYSPSSPPEIIPEHPHKSG